MRGEAEDMVIVEGRKRRIEKRKTRENKAVERDYRISQAGGSARTVGH
jgi:hypothetical protein